ncbi:MAG: hypothetical protein HKN70_11080, partial [Gammaproteobacteria bacterium]|nr:hypothetical protein [Gammaproteobacteria bacterium]
MEHASNVVDVVSAIVLLLLVAAVVLAVTKRIRFPFSVLLVMVGMGMAALVERFDALLAPLQHIQLSPALILYVFLPALIFESAYNLDSKQLRQNLRAVLTLAIPGLLLSTAIIGTLLHFATTIPFSAALLLGAILSATDPVAVIALFKRLGAPQQLTVLVEGESLFNDAASIVLSGILVGIVLAGGITGGAVFHGVLKFMLVFFGGLLVGWLLALLTGWLLGLVESDPAIEITLTTILAYASFIIAEHAFQVSGVMATVAAGLTLGGWGRTKLSSTIRTYVEHFWEYIAFVATALIFLMVGLRVDPLEVFSHADVLVWVIIAMLVSRAVVIFTLIPVVDRFTQSINHTSLGYQTVMYWGGLRGAIAMAIALSLPAFEQAGLFVTLVMGAVLFTLLVQGLTMESLVHWLGLDRM